jgi:hypothetical protein
MEKIRQSDGVNLNKLKRENGYVFFCLSVWRANVVSLKNDMDGQNRNYSVLFGRDFFPPCLYEHWHRD